MPAWDHLVTPLVLLFGGLAAWGDLRPMLPYLFRSSAYGGAVHGRISNRLLLAWLIFGLVALGGGLLYEAAGGPFPASEWIRATEGWHYAPAVLLNALLAFTLGVTLWVLGLWAAGDAKMFALLALTLPLSVYRNNYLSFFPSFALFFNAFIAMFSLLLLEFLVATALETGRSRGALVTDKLKAAFGAVRHNWRQVARLVLLFLALFTVVRILRHFAREGLDQIMEMNKTVLYLLLFLFFRPLVRLAAHRLAMLVAGAVLVGYLVFAFFFDATGEARWELVNIGWLAISVILFRVIYDAYLKATDEVELPPEQLRQGMILGESTLKRFSERKQFMKEKLGELTPDGLSGEQAEALREWYRENEPQGVVAVSRTIPFAPALFAGAILTWLSGGLVMVF